MSIAALTCSGNATLNGNVTLGNAGADDLTITASLASSIPIKTNDSFDIGSSTLGLQNLYLGGTGGTTAITGAASITTYTVTLPGTVGVAGQALLNEGSGELAWKPSQIETVAKSAAYTITDTDKVRTILHTTGASDYDVTLPTAADNTHRIITLKKVDSGAGKVTLKGEAAGETIDGVSGATGIALKRQYEELTVQCDGSIWHIVSKSVGGLVPGKVDGVAIASGYVGEQIASSDFQSSSLTSGVAENEASLTLTAGVWQIYGQVFYNQSGGEISLSQTSISGTSATLDLNYAEFNSSTSSDRADHAFRYVNISSSTTYYLVVSATFTNTCVINSSRSQFYAIRVG